MVKHHKKLLDQLDNLMIALAKQKHIGLDADVIIALKNLTRARNAFKREFIKANAVLMPRQETVFTSLLDLVADHG